MTCGAILTLTGQLSAESALPWIHHRGQLLNLAGWVRREDDQTIRMALAGPEPLIEAMEIACSLGPGDVLVDTITRARHTFDEKPDTFVML
ncbi:acylphosphatase [uncultured Roseobacter sp.]|uniref:acylphosphatase n=1 Tax=uncultured Roseobacter sp. TaxID=114847 RepID=UPI002626EEB1|nr:acylphosphatase [uncultured Roseobacter sp.]